jgi:hypothetical protein
MQHRTLYKSGPIRGLAIWDFTFISPNARRTGFHPDNSNSHNLTFANNLKWFLYGVDMRKPFD